MKKIFQRDLEVLEVPSEVDWKTNNLGRVSEPQKSVLIYVNVLQEIRITAFGKAPFKTC